MNRSDLVEVFNGEIMASSYDVAMKMGKNNSNVMRDARNIMKKLENSQPSILRGEIFKESTRTSRGREYQIIMMNRDGFSLLAMGFTGQKAFDWKVKFLNAFNMMESYISKALDIIPTMKELNILSRSLKQHKEVGSFHGRGLSNYKKNHLELIDKFKATLDVVQIDLF